MGGAPQDVGLADVGRAPQPAPSPSAGLADVGETAFAFLAPVALQAFALLPAYPPLVGAEGGLVVLGSSSHAGRAAR